MTIEGDLAVGFNEEAVSGQTQSKVGVLIVDAGRESRAFLQGLLVSTGLYDVKTTASGVEGLEVLAKGLSQKIGVVIMDWALEDVAGPIFAQKAHGFPGHSSMDFIVISKQMSQEESFLLTELDIWHYLSKQESGKGVIDRVASVIAERKAHASVLPQMMALQDALRDGDQGRCDNLTADARVAAAVRDNPRFLHIQGELCIQRGDYEGAATQMQALLRKGESSRPETLKMLSTLGRALCLAARFEDALVIFERLAAKSPQNLSHKIACGDALASLEKGDDAKEYYQQALDTDETHNGALIGMGKVSLMEGNEAKAKGFFERIEGPFESYALASFFNNRGVALARSGRTVEAIQFYQNALIFLEKFRPQIIFNLGLAHFKNADHASASKCFQEVIKSENVSFLSTKRVLKHFQEKSTEEYFQVSASGGGQKLRRA